MEGLETPYDVEGTIEFIDCTVCSKSIRGDTLYKIHLTTAGHLKKEDALVAQGLAIRDHTVPDFEDIVQYLQYLKLDEPIIGLNYLEEVPGTDASDPQPGPRYLCKLCDLHANLPNMVNHVIGRKHRQKYLQLKRPDLVTWDKTTMMSQSGKVIRAKAEVVERQDGQGTPRPMRKNRTVGKSNISRVLPKQKQKMDHSVPQSVAQLGVPLHPPALMDYEGEYSHRGRRPLDDPNTPPFHPNDPYLRDDPLSCDLMEDEMRRPDYMESDVYRQELMEADYDREYQEDYVEDMHRRDVREPGGFPRRDSREEMPHRQAYHGDTYPEEAPPDRRPHPESDPLKQFYSEEVRRGRVRSAEAAEPRRKAYPLHDPRGAAYPEDDPDRYSYPPEDSEPAYPGEGPHERESSRDYTDYSHASVHDEERTRKRGGYPEEETRRRAFPEEEPLWPAYPEDEHHQWSLDREPGRHGNMNGAGRQGSGDPEAKRRRFPEPLENDQPYDKDHLFEMVRAFRQERRAPQKGEAADNPGPSRTGPPASQRPLEVARSISEIPEPFRRFLEGAASNQDDGKRKRKSRFSDATEEEVERAKGMLTDAYRNPTRPTRPEVHGPQRPDPFVSPYHAETYQRGSSKSLSENTADPGIVFDLLKNIEIENVEEADFLKDKLCHLLKEFQAKKSEKTVHNSQGRAVISKDYNHLSQDQQESPWGQYERGLREGPEGRPFENQPRRSEECYSQEAPRGRDWEEQEQLPEEQYQEYCQPSHPEPRSTSRSRYEEVFGRPRMFQPPHAAHPEETELYPERFQEPMHPHDYPPAAEEFFDPPSSAPPFHREQGYRMRRGPQHSSSLDKITSTLLELVARK
ncbi:uncharacterized protein LOC139915854 isoform X1 [Centroberyx gerrardi]|uniref:uncharacterized protein isoform X1 n=2 Tax=Centroberyx gerrardi TaxID=166262 RepID=UPI003AABB5D6